MDKILKFYGQTREYTSTIMSFTVITIPFTAEPSPEFPTESVCYVCVLMIDNSGNSCKVGTFSTVAENIHELNGHWLWAVST